MRSGGVSNRSPSTPFVLSIVDLSLCLSLSNQRAKRKGQMLTVRTPRSDHRGFHLPPQPYTWTVRWTTDEVDEQIVVDHVDLSVPCEWTLWSRLLESIDEIVTCSPIVLHLEHHPHLRQILGILHLHPNLSG